ncbi:MAG: hypothetical protein IPG35_07055 [Flavobacteriales bacterium]|nr:hypothetical protein [Flavobacteriales bacterium]
MPYYYFDAIVVEEVGEPAISRGCAGRLVWSWMAFRELARQHWIVWSFGTSAVDGVGNRDAFAGPKASLDVHALALGTYVVEVIGGGWRATAKWTKVE